MKERLAVTVRPLSASNHRVKTAAWILVIAFGLNAAWGPSAFADTDSLPGGGNNTSQMPAVHGINTVSQWDEITIVNPVTTPKLIQPGVPSLTLPQAVPGQLAAVQPTQLTLPQTSSVQSLTVVQTPPSLAPLPSLSVSLGSSSGLIFLSYAGPLVRDPAQFNVLQTNRAFTSLTTPVTPNVSYEAYGPVPGPGDQWWSTLEKNSRWLQWLQRLPSLIANNTTQSAGSGSPTPEITIVQISDGNEGAGRGANSPGMPGYSQSASPANTSPVAFVVSFYFHTRATDRFLKETMRTLMQDIAQSLFEWVLGSGADPHRAVQTEASAQSNSQNPTKTTVQTRAFLAAQEAMGSLVRGVELILAPNVAAAVSRFFEFIVPALAESHIFERFKTGLSQFDWMFRESTVIAQPDARPAVNGEAGPDTAPTRELIRAIRSLWTDLSALRAGAAAKPDVSPAGLDAAMEAEISASDMTALEAAVSAPVIGSSADLLLKDQDALTFKRVTTEIIIGDVLKVVKAAIEFGIAYRYNPSGAVMSVTGVFS